MQRVKPPRLHAPCGGPRGKPACRGSAGSGRLFFHDRFQAAGGRFNRSIDVLALEQLLHERLHHPLAFDVIEFWKKLGGVRGDGLTDRHVILQDELQFRVVLEIRVGGERFSDRQLGNVPFGPEVLFVLGPPFQELLGLPGACLVCRA